MGSGGSPTSDPLGAHLTWCAIRNLRPSTINQRRLSYWRLARALGRPPLSASDAQLEAWWLGLSLSAHSRATELAHVRAFYLWTVRQGLRVGDPTHRLTRPRVPRGLPRPMPDADLALALQHAPERLRPWLHLAAYAGLRACEIAPLRREDIDDTSMTVFVRDGKGGKPRIVPLHSAARAALGRLPAHGWLFGRLDGKSGPPRAHTVTNVSNAFLHSLGITSTLHTCRHWFGTNVYRISLDLRLTQELLGHESPVTTSGYAAWSPKRGSAVVQSLVVKA